MSNIKNDFLFLGLTRLTLFFGVTVEYFTLNSIITFSLIINLNNIFLLFIGIIFHLIGYYICFNDAMLVGIYLKKYSKFNLCKNKFFYKANSYLV